MATYRKRGNSWRVELWVGTRGCSASFSTKREARLWAEPQQRVLRRQQGDDVPDRPFRDLMARQAREVSPHKRGARREQNRVNPVRDVRRLSPPPSRTRRPSDGETEALLLALGYHPDPPRPSTRNPHRPRRRRLAVRHRNRDAGRGRSAP